MRKSPFADRLAVLHEQMAQAARRSGRSVDDVTLVAVTKTVPVELIEQAAGAGLKDFGESRVQEMARKSGAFAAPLALGLRWHMVGHLQTNKAKKAAQLFDVIQSLDSLRLAEMLNREAAALNKRLPCLVEVKLSTETAKLGALPEEVPALLDKIRALPHLKLEGLMTVAPYFEDAEKTRPAFACLRELSEKNRALFESDKPVLSMGMSHDFAAAIEEGATLIRVGTALFGERTP